MTVEGIKPHGCKCGKDHLCDVSEVVTGNGAINLLPEKLRLLGGAKPFILADKNTFAACGEKVTEILKNEEIAYSSYVFPHGDVKPDEKAVGAAIMHFDTSCDIVVGVGSGVINDISKILANVSKSKYIIVATAPSMDGYASATSSVDRDGLKVSLQSRCADIIIGDTEILKNAPEKSLVSGLGDIIAKYISIAEWRISHLINGEYYCDDIAALIRKSVKLCVDNAEGLKNREDAAVEAVFNGLVYAGAAMSFANASRPASGNEHYFSHIWDMRALEFGCSSSTHGIQCAIGTLICAKLYEKLCTVEPNREKAVYAVNNFSLSEHWQDLRRFLGKGAETMIELEKKENKYSFENYGKRIDAIIKNFDGIKKIVAQEIPSGKTLEKLLDSVGCPKTPKEIGIDSSTVPETFAATKDIRDKYILSRLVFDLGLTDEFCEYIETII